MYSPANFNYKARIEGVCSKGSGMFDTKDISSMMKFPLLPAAGGIPVYTTVTKTVQVKMPINN